MKQIPLSQGKFAIVDDEDYDFLMQWKWHFNPDGYARRKERQNGIRKSIFMHRLINKTPEGLQTDHIDTNRLNNTKKNLRNATAQMNRQNMSKTRGTSKYKGVCWVTARKKWQAAIKVNGKVKWLGTFKNEEDAAKAYDKAALEYYGIFARINHA